MIACVVGGLGAGKTLAAVHLGLAEMATGRPVACNFDLVGASRLSTWREWMTYMDGCLIWDEAHLDLDSRLFAKNVAVTTWLTQIRKLGVDLLYVTQAFNQVDLRLRQLTDLALVCERSVINGSRGTRIQIVDLFSARLRSTITVPHTSKLYNSYDTRGLVTPLSGELPTLADIRLAFSLLH